MTDTDFKNVMLPDDPYTPDMDQMTDTEKELFNALHERGVSPEDILVYLHKNRFSQTL